MSKPIFNLTPKTRVWAVRFVSLPNADFMGMVLQEEDAPAPLVRYRFRYHDAGPGFDAPDTKRVYEVHDDSNDPKRLVALLDLATSARPFSRAFPNVLFPPKRLLTHHTKPLL